MSADSHKHHGNGFYFVILLALLGLTILTYLTARPWDSMVPDMLHVPLALFIALVKATLVTWFFMHLNQHGPQNKAFFGVSIFFVALMIAMIVGDVASRNPTANPNFPQFKEMRGSW